MTPLLVHWKEGAPGSLHVDPFGAGEASLSADIPWELTNRNSEAFLLPPTFILWGHLVSRPELEGH